VCKLDLTFLLVCFWRARLKNAGRIWELIKKSPFISDYSRTLNKMCLYQKS